MAKDTNPRMRARALQLLARIQGQEKKYVDQAVKDKSDDVRVAGLRMARALKLDVVAYVKKLANDSSAAGAPRMRAGLAAQ